nr:hypothetical protein Puna18p_00072 [Serratia proteamaculans]
MWDTGPMTTLDTHVEYQGCFTVLRLCHGYEQGDSLNLLTPCKTLLA